jgi:uncharacterized protein
VLAELIALANARGVPADAALRFVMNLLASPDIATIWPDESLTSRGLTLLMARQDRGYSLCDAVSFVLMRAHNLREALSTDRYFDDEGFQRQLV